MNWREYHRMQRVCEVGERFLGYVDAGRGDPIVLLHGIPTWGYLWHALLPVLATERRVLIPDLLGFGFSDRSDRFDRSLPRQMLAIEAWMDALGIPAADFVGHDLGTGLVQRMAALRPGRVRSMMLMNGVCYDNWPVEAFLQTGHPSVARVPVGITLRVIRATLRRGFALRPPRALLDGILAPYSTSVGMTSLVRDASALDTNHTTEIAPLLPAIDIPAMVLWGEEDPFLPVEYAERLVQDLPRARLHRLQGARHFLMLDQPAEVGLRMLEFLAGTSPARRPHGAPAAHLH